MFYPGKFLFSIFSNVADQDSFILLVFSRYFNIDLFPYSFSPFLQVFALKALIDQMKKFAFEEMSLLW